MYARRSLLAQAQEVFEEVPMRAVDLWNAKIAGYVREEHCEEALKCFQQMQLEGVSPNSVTFVCSLKACHMMGDIDKGREIQAEIARVGLLERNLVVGNALVDMYA
eukprot:c25021_g7_i1 orf=1-315(-)